MYFFQEMKLYKPIMKRTKMLCTSMQRAHLISTQNFAHISLVKWIIFLPAFIYLLKKSLRYLYNNWQELFEYKKALEPSHFSCIYFNYAHLIPSKLVPTQITKLIKLHKEIALLRNTTCSLCLPINVFFSCSLHAPITNLQISKTSKRYPLPKNYQ